MSSFDQIQFEPESLRRAAAGMDDAAQELLSKAQALLSEVGDVSALGTNDTLGSIASMLYSAVLARVQETVDSVSSELGAHGGALASAAEGYAGTEDANAQLGTSTWDGSGGGL
ncbi:WXG100 family type VII secretion target [Auraticoccus monumenti]|uniref:Excreted virulence factor EspC, type VII ESX diderm n=1 Tax=Auraticoccus monumenti TaxID=675864 RepID=A0A1G6XKY4_9ACTN|nr:hypothetical protein [Auraticoccus monumenti]SDD77957.1 hypothetical protein SAMN04489747_1723 [Auraticoccus monumenti]